MTTRKVNSQDKVILNMKMPSHCGECKLCMKTCEGKNFCLITRKPVNVDCKCASCPLQPVPGAKPRTPLPKLSACPSCGSTRFNKRTHISDVTFKYIECKKCGLTSESLPGKTWRAAIEGWNSLIAS